LQAEVGERHGEPDITGEREAGVDCTHHPDDPGSLQIVGDSASSDDAQMVVDELLELVSEEAEIRQRGRFKRKCMVVANTYLLSRKETEVLFLLAKGRNAAAIQEILYIAAGTANTHMRHIYRKLDVHSQQELIELVESTEIGDWDD
jgi:DNA-binding CsgD family transcriptional regulator